MECGHAKYLIAATVAVPLLILSATPALSSTSPSTSGPSYSSKSDLMDAYLKASYARPSLFQAAPITQIVPQQGVNTFALDARLYNAEIDDPENSSPLGTATGGSSLTIKGYSVAPYLALQLKRSGIGVSVESGSRSINYQNVYQVASPRQADRQQSDVRYRGLGVYGFYKLYDASSFGLTFIGGVKDIGVTHTLGPDEHTSDGTTYQSYGAGSETYNYEVRGVDLGLNADVRLVKALTFIPWLDYAGAWASNPANSVPLAAEQKLMWHAERPLRYGLDFAVHLARFDVHLGGLFGLIATSLGTPTAVKNNGYSLSFSWNEKG